MNKSLRPWRDQYCRCRNKWHGPRRLEGKGLNSHQCESEFRFSVVWYLMYYMELELLNDGPSSMRGEVTTFRNPVKNQESRWMAHRGLNARCIITVVSRMQHFRIRNRLQSCINPTQELSQRRVNHVGTRMSSRTIKASCFRISKVVTVHPYFIYTDWY